MVIWIIKKVVVQLDSLATDHKFIPGMGRKKSTPKSAFLLGINIGMINQIKYSGLFPERHASPVGTTQGMNQPKPVAPVVPVQMQPVKS